MVGPWCLSELGHLKGVSLSLDGRITCVLIAVRWLTHKNEIMTGFTESKETGECGLEM